MAARTRFSGISWQRRCLVSEPLRAGTGCRSRFPPPRAAPAGNIRRLACCVRATAFRKTRASKKPQFSGPSDRAVVRAGPTGQETGSPTAFPHEIRRQSRRGEGLRASRRAADVPPIPVVTSDNKIVVRFSLGRDLNSEGGRRFDVWSDGRFTWSWSGRSRRARLSATLSAKMVAAARRRHPSCCGRHVVAHTPEGPWLSITSNHMLRQDIMLQGKHSFAAIWRQSARKHAVLVHLSTSPTTGERSRSDRRLMQARNPWLPPRGIWLSGSCLNVDD